MTASARPLPRSREEAVAAELAGERLKFLFFWGHRPTKGGGPGPGCLSQWWRADFTADGVTYPTAEHYMMAHKAWLFGDGTAAERVLSSPDPGHAKAVGREVAGFDETVWAARRQEIVVRGNHAKFSGVPALGDYLAGTRSRVLVEASPLDRVWGIGLPADHAHAPSPRHWRGPNLLGFALMEVRELLPGPST
ncbi:NADAR family protein [Streptomyces iconiensis]|uniref:NADAR family protein n=1 Tax=Streptomyces iconiensis TaxID=1384038 RepID=A0ABT7A4X2_9ACTN|nr:NADAR family protein [Streptomyces iconiensis]MDJ1136107.1 NADAR family protein [Streptomyces iconiensis]